MTNDTKSQQLEDAGISVIRPVVRTAGVPTQAALPYVARSVEDRIKILSDITLTLTPAIPKEQSATGRAVKAKLLTVRQVAVWPSNANAKSGPSQKVGLVECRESGEVFFLWSHIGKVNGAFAPVVYDLAPELLAAAFQRSMDERAAMPEELRAAMGFVG